MNNKIHFAVLFGVDYETDLLPFWAPWYRNMKLDSYKAFLHRENGEINRHLIEEFHDYGFDTEVVTGHQGNGILRKLILGHHSGTLPPDDFLVTADADELQVQAHDTMFQPPDYRELERTYDVITGYMLDRYGTRLEECYDNPFNQYSSEEPFTKEILKSFTPPFLKLSCGDDWPITRRTKILAARAGYPVAFEGSHCMRSIPANARIDPIDYKVLHFAWRESTKRKIAVKSYYTIRTLDAIFGGKAPEEYRNHLSQISPSTLLASGTTETFATEKAIVRLEHAVAEKFGSAQEIPCVN